ncbi:MAG: DNA-binding protein [Lentisphaerae bacterium]|jgi:uncharacterized protein|nr:DNA-binding protein [Lentisphaerota bacterium]MBT4818405.1 DNA-binding protein [Lentisphaerota bacterium]MBT5610683.1 DNA-binding protein [Lentisphaerota bacterium]MBT7058039.1 DNA-binding protein [Lentisphaerota bacterium]MBT7840661.1 DNA-binding protein [Lentisphaerota bacterium]
MKVAGGNVGRVFFLRLEDGDVLHESVEQFARDVGIQHGACWFLGGADTGSKLIVGPEDGRAERIVPTLAALDGVHEAAGVGTIVPGESGEPILHMHAVFGRGEATRSGCVRAGVATWLIGEVVVLEVLDCPATRRRDPASGFELLETD